MNNKLMVKLNGQWKYVFCRNVLESCPVITNQRELAIDGNTDSLNYFSNHFGNHEFSINIQSEGVPEKVKCIMCNGEWYDGQSEYDEYGEEICAHCGCTGCSAKV